MKKYTVICALHPEIASDCDCGEPVEHYTALVTAKDPVHASVVGHKEATKSWKAELKEFKQHEECRGRFVSPARVLVLVIFDGHPKNLCFGWATGYQPKEKP